MTLSPELELERRRRIGVAKELLGSNLFLLGRLGVAAKARALQELERAGFDPWDYGTLAVLSEGMRETQSTVADALRLDPSRMVAILDSLEKRGLVERQRDPHDRRRHLVSITGSGRKQLVRLRAIVKEAEDEFLAPLDAESRAQLHDLLLRLAAHHDPRCVPERTSGRD
jgi:DNA-binding MarR family transcriptional regulator